MYHVVLTSGHLLMLIFPTREMRTPLTKDNNFNLPYVFLNTWGYSAAFQNIVVHKYIDVAGNGNVIEIKNKNIINLYQYDTYKYEKHIF